MDHTNWIWTPAWCAGDDAFPRVVFFRKKLTLAQKPARAEIRISADSRYKLYVNGSLRQTGPSKGDDKVWYVDEMDIAGDLRSGENVLAVAVLRYPLDGTAGNHSLFRTRIPGLFLKGGAYSEAGESLAELSADESWRCHINRQTQFYAEEERFAPLIIHEKAGADPLAFGWKRPGFDDGPWELAKPYLASELPENESPARLSQRTIPFMDRHPRTLDRVFDVPKSDLPTEAWESFIGDGAHPVSLAPGTETSVVFDAGEEMTGYPCLALSGGKGSRIELLYAECYVLPTEAGQVKGNRQDKENGILTGYSDTYTVLGLGTEENPETYEPYWFRTFRFIRMTVHVGEQPLTLHSFYYEETGYPLEVGTEAVASDRTLSDIWDISLRTLRRCMHETYMDCPYYEQLQYAMDARSQILYTYAVSADDRLARKTIDDFSRAQRPDGLLNCSYPNMNTNVIPGFSIYYILMVYDHMMYFGDKALVRRYMPVIRRILQFFDSHRTEDGLVDKVGGVNGKAPLWSFIDWAKDWMPTEGMPTSGLNGPITMESLLYILGLQKTAELCEYTDLPREAEVYRACAKAVQAAIRRRCMDESGMITDGPGSRELSQHAQVFGVLTDTLTVEEGRRNLLKTIQDRDYTQCTVAMCYYLFRALEKTGLYAYTDQYWEIWRRMLRSGCTTCVEAEDYARSECHAWGALILYELPSVILGVRPAAPGYEKVMICPVSGYLTSASGTVGTPRGDIAVCWVRQAKGIDLKIQCTDELKKSIIIAK